MTTPAGWKLLAALAFTLLLAAPPLRAGEDRPEAPRAALRALEEKAVQLKSEGKMEEAKAVRREMEELRERAKNREREAVKGDREDGDERVAHIRQAMEHLRAAGLDDLAERIGQEAKRRFEEDQNREREVRREGGGTGIEQLRAEVQELRQHIRKLAERLEQSERKR